MLKIVKEDSCETVFRIFLINLATKWVRAGAGPRDHQLPRDGV
jgi:hypothetical protein